MPNPLVLMLKRILPAAAFLVLPACADDVVSPAALRSEGTMTVVATNNFQFVSLRDSAVITPSPSPTASSAWDIAFFSTNVTLNGGEAGPGGVTAACLCQNATATNAQVLAMTPENQFMAFDTVRAVPAGLTFSSDRLTPAISGWFTGTGASAVADANRTWLVRLSDSTSFAAVRVAEITGATSAHAGSVTLEYRLQANATAPLGAAQRITVNAGAVGGTRVDLNSGTTTADAAAWDLQVQGFTIRVNGGISGNGKGGAATTATAFAGLTTAVTGAAAYRIDTYTGVFGTQRYFRYNIAGDFRINPTFDVYFLRRGADTYKLQIIDYYSVTGAARHITFRWAKLD